MTNKIGRIANIVLAIIVGVVLSYYTVHGRSLFTRAEHRGLTPLMLAIDTGKADITQIDSLIDQQHDLNVQEPSHRYTALHIAVLKNRYQIVAALLRHHADANTHSTMDETPLRSALLSGRSDIAMLLVTNGADPNVHDRCDHGFTPLHACAGKIKDPDLLKLLIAHHAEVNIRSDDGETPLHVAANFDNVDNATTLLNCGAAVNAQDDIGMTPLDLAAFYGNTDMISFLLAHHANAALKTQNGLTALDIARKAKRPDAVKLLLRAPASQ